MQNKTAHQRSTRAAPLTALGVGAVFAAALLSGCSSTGENPLTKDNPFTVFVDPGKYAYYNCEQIAGQQKYWQSKEQELRELMNRAEKSTGGGAINVIAYQTDYTSAKEELKVLDTTARSKNCKPPQN
jgi:hypothetical protein